MKRRHTTSGLPDTYGPGHSHLRRYPMGCGIKDFIFLLHQDHPIRSSASLRCTRPAIHSGHRASKRQCSISAIQTGRLRTMIAYSSARRSRLHLYGGLGSGDAKPPTGSLVLRIVTRTSPSHAVRFSGRAGRSTPGGHKTFRFPAGGHRAPAAEACCSPWSCFCPWWASPFCLIHPKLCLRTAAAATAEWRVWRAVWLALGCSTVLNVLYFLYTAMLIWVPEETEHAQRPKRFSSGGAGYGESGRGPSPPPDGGCSPWAWG